MWSHIIAIIRFDTNIEDIEIQKRIEEKVAAAPQITGSEENATIKVNIPDGYNLYTTAQCNNCIFGIKRKDGPYDCVKKSGGCPPAQYQTSAFISICGDLRDRHIEQTKNELNKFVDYLENVCNFMFIEGVAAINDDGDISEIFYI